MLMAGWTGGPMKALRQKETRHQKLEKGSDERFRRLREGSDSTAFDHEAARGDGVGLARLLFSAKERRGIEMLTIE